MEPVSCERRIEGSSCGEDGREIMVELVGSDVFVDGVGGHGGGGDPNGEKGGGGGGLVKEGLESKMESVDDEGAVISGFASQEVGTLGRTETQVEGFQETAGSSGEQTHVSVEDISIRVDEEGLERGDSLVGRGGDASDEAQNSGIETEVGCSLEISGSSRELTQDSVAERVVVIVSEDGLERGLVEESVEKGLKPVEGGEGALVELASQRVGVLDDELQNPGIGAAVVCSSSVAESSSVQTPIVAKGVTAIVNDEVLDHKDEVLGSGAGQGNLISSENNRSSVAKTVSVKGDKDGAIHSDAESSKQKVEFEVEVAVGGEAGVINKQGILHPKGNFHCLVDNQQMKVETAGENAVNRVDLRADSISICEPTMVDAGSKVTTLDDKVSSNSNVGATKNVVLGEIGADAGEVGIICADSESSIEQVQLAAEFLVANDCKISISSTITQAGGGMEPLSTENRVLGASDENKDYLEDQKLKDKNVGRGLGKESAVCTEQQSSHEKNDFVNGNEVSAMDSKVSYSEVQISTKEEIGRTVTCSEDYQNMKCGTTCGISEIDGHVCADTEPLNEHTCVAEIEEVTVMDVEVATDIKGEVAGVDALDGSCSGEGKDQVLRVEKVYGSCDNDVVHGDPDSSDKQTQIADRSDIVVIGKEFPKLEGEAIMHEDEKVSNHKIEVLDGDTCLHKDEELNTETVGRSIGKDNNAPGNAEASDEQIEIDNGEESSVLHYQDIVQMPACYTLDENVSLSEKDEELKIETLGKSMIKDPLLGVDSPPIGDHGTSVRPCSDSLEDSTSSQGEKLGTVAQLDDIHTYEVDGDQSINMMTVDETSAQGVCAVALSIPVVENSAAFHAALNCSSTHNEGDPVSSSVSDFMSTLSDQHQNLQVHVISSDISLQSENPIIATRVSDEVVNPEAKGESYKADEHVPEGQGLNKSMVGRLVVDLGTCLNRDGKWESQDGSVNKNVPLPEESQFVRDDAQAMGGIVGLDFSECFDGNATGDLCLDDSSVGQEVEVQERYTDAEQVDLYGGQESEMGEHQKSFEGKRSKQTTLKPGSSGKVYQAKYLLAPQKGGDFFSLSDLVWGKVKSHPWWPGQIFDPADASEKALKHYKKDCFLVAYFGDRTFAWNEASLLKPFFSNFSQIEKQSNLEGFQNAVSCALEEVSRRIELGLACRCIPKDGYDKIESQIVENTGIRQESSRRYGVDKCTGVSSFEPDKLVEYVRALAQSPSAGADRLELVIAKAQLLAFNQFKGYCQLPEFQFCGGLLENNADSSQLGEVIDHALNDEQILPSRGMLKIEKSSLHKRKHNLKDIVYPWKKERSLSELMGDMASSPDGEDGSDWKASSKSVSSSSGRKRRAVDFLSDGSEVQDRRISFYAAKVSTTASPTPKPSFKVGECIRRVASQLTGSPSILKCSSEKFQKVDGRSDIPVGSDVSLQTPDNSHRERMNFLMENSSLDEMLSQLQSAAQDPMKGYNFLPTIITFYSGFRNSICLGHYSGRRNSFMGNLGGGRKKKASHAIIGSSEEFEFEFEFDDENDSYWTDRIIQNNSEEQPSGDSQDRAEYQLVAFDPDKSLKSSRRSYSRKRFSNGNHEMALVDPTGYIDERKQDVPPTELILNFSEGDSVPSEMNLNKIFRRFGPLKESETEVDLETSRARVVFKRCSDAEVAFSSAGKFKIFGPMIVNYQLTHSSSISFKTLPLVTPQGQEDAT